MFLHFAPVLAKITAFHSLFIMLISFNLHLVINVVKPLPLLAFFTGIHIYKYRYIKLPSTNYS